MSEPRWWWVSWDEVSEDYRPLHDPPAAPVLGWWCSGAAMSGAYSTLVALVEAPHPEDAMLAVQADWPGKHRRWRFCEEWPIGKRPGDRFPLNGWALERVAASEKRAQP